MKYLTKSGGLSNWKSRSSTTKFGANLESVGGCLMWEAMSVIKHSLPISSLPITPWMLKTNVEEMAKHNIKSLLAHGTSWLGSSIPSQSRTTIPTNYIYSIYIINYL